jgi:uncharacterized protein
VTEPSFEEEVKALVGRPMSSRGPSTAPDPVNQSMIRHWATAFGDENPVYTDSEAAAGSRFGQVVAPPLMLQTWTMPTPELAGIAERGGAPVEQGSESPLTVFDEAGFTGTVASDSEFEFERYVHLGEVLSATTALESVSERKQTRLGPGYFVVWLTTYLDEAGEVVGRQRFGVLKFEPGGA